MGGEGREIVKIEEIIRPKFLGWCLVEPRGVEPLTS